MSQQLQPENVNQLPNSPVDLQVEGERLPVPKRSAKGLSIGGDSIADLIRKAKASRTANGSGLKKIVENTKGETSVAIVTPMDETLESALSCPICSEYLYKPVAAISCLHTFCGSCLVSWLKRSSVCPNCRTRVIAIKDDHRTNNLLEMYLKLHPEKARTEEDIVERDKIYKPGDVVTITRAADDYSDDEGNEEDEEDEDELVVRMLPCDYCYPPEPLQNGLACEHPIPPPPAPVDGIEYIEGIEHHSSCNVCMRTMPRREGMACESCNFNWCGSLFVCTRQDVLRKFEDMRPTPFIGGWAAQFNLFGANDAERAIYDHWAQVSQLQNSDIVDRFKEWFLEEAAKVDFVPGIPIMRPTSQTVLCEICFLHWMRICFMNWWITEKEKSGVVDNRPKCWYGKNCRTQRHNPDHAARLNHACHEIPLEERRVPLPQQRPPLGNAGRHPPLTPRRIMLDAPVGVPELGAAQPAAAVNAPEVATVAAAQGEAEAADLPTFGGSPDDPLLL
ncbi:hypothetical protein EV426DRAFT_669739 [Tirmania nivea]|nr:hypothetical protein EV426DRAFT_669739 [Tirmania nivea]